MSSSSIVAHVARRIDRAGRVRHRGIAKHADDVQQRVGVAERRDVEQRLRAGLRAADAGDVGELDRRRHVLARVEQRGQPIEPLVGHPRDADVRFRLARAAEALRGRWSAAERARSFPTTESRSSLHEASWTVARDPVAQREPVHLGGASFAEPNLHIASTRCTPEPSFARVSPGEN